MIALESGQRMLWQWDTGQRLVLDYPAGTLIDLSTNGSDVAGRIAYEESGAVYVDIPDSMLTCSGQLYVYVSHMEGDSRTTVLEASVAIRSRSKPADYSPPGDEEVLYWRKLAQDTEAAAERAAASADRANREADRAAQSGGGGGSGGGPYDAVRYGPQELTEVEKEQARKNIDAMPADTQIPVVPEWAMTPTKPEYTAREVGALPSDTTIPSRTSELTNDSGFTTKAYIDTVLGGISALVGGGF